MMKPATLLFAILVLLAGPVAAGGDGIHVRTLENGLRIVVKEDHSKPLAALRIYVGTGGALEMDFLGCGISHYYEHLLSGGTTSTRTEAESAKILQSLGGQSNAYTTADHTCYHVVTHRDFIDTAIDLYGDWMKNNVLDPTEVAREKGVIIKEFNKGEDEPGRVLYNLFASTMFRVHPVRVPTIGYREIFLQITRDDLVSYYRNRYAPGNTVVAVAGDVDPAKIFAAVTKSMGDWEPRPESVLSLRPEPRQVKERYAEVEMDVEQASVRMGFHTIDLFHEDLYALDMVAAVLGTGRTSRLVTRIVEEEKLTDAISAYSYTPHFMTGTFGLSFEVPVSKLDEILAVVKDEIARIKDGPVTKAELDRAKVQVVSGYLLSTQKVEDQASRVGRNLMTTGDPRFEEQYVKRIQSVTPEQLLAAARKWLDLDQLTVAVVRPIRKAEDVAKKAADVEASTVQREVLPSGLTLLVKRTPGVTPVGIEMFAHGGLRAEPAGKNGVSFLTGRLLVRGTKKRSASDIARETDGIGATIASQSGNNTIGLSLTLARGEMDVPFAVELLADILINATYPEDQFAKELQVLSFYAARQDASWEREVANFMRRELFGTHPYANSPFSTPPVVAGLTREDVLAFAKARIRPEGMVIAVAGEVDVAKTLDLLRGALGGFAGEGDFELPAPAAPVWEEAGLPANRFVFKENQKAQAALAIGFPGTRYTNLEDRAALTVVDAFTSGIGLPSGWLHNALRGGDRSYVYYIHLTNFTGLEPGSVYIVTQTEVRYLAEVYGLVMAEIERLRKGGFTEEELARGRAMALVALPYYAQTVNDVAQGIALSELYGAGYDGDAKFEALLSKVTREDVMRVVKRHFGNMVVAVAGPKEARAAFEELKLE